MSNVLLKVVTIEGKVFEDVIEGLHIKTIDGEVTILPHHFPLLTSVATSICHFYKDGEMIKAFVDEGILKVSVDEIELIVASFNFKDNIDIDRAKKARDRAKNRLEMNDENIDKIRAQKALIRAEARISLWED